MYGRGYPVPASKPSLTTLPIGRTSWANTDGGPPIQTEKMSRVGSEYRDTYRTGPARATATIDSRAGGDRGNWYLTENSGYNRPRPGRWSPFEKVPRFERAVLRYNEPSVL